MVNPAPRSLVSSLRWAALSLLISSFGLAAAPLRFARAGLVEGTAEVQLYPADPWRAAIRNTPLPPGARFRTEGSRFETELDEGSVFRLTGTSLAELSDYLTLSTGQHLTLLSLDHGTAYFTARHSPHDTLSLTAPGVQLTFRTRARVRLEASASFTQIAVLEGTVRFATPSAELDLREGQMARVRPSSKARFELFREIPIAEADEWSAKRDALQEGSFSARHLPGFRYGAADLDLAGSWLQTDDAGLVWKPKPAEGWLPFQAGNWQWFDQCGYTWISTEEWGWAPYHFGRWLQHGSLGWVWSPGTSGTFKPGEVYWMQASGLALWGPLAPGEFWSGQGPPRQFAAANTLIARFLPGQRTFQPAAGLEERKNLFASAQFTAALPSPPLPASRLDFVNPPLASLEADLLPHQSAPTVTGASFEPRQVSAAPATLAPPPARPPVTVIVDRPVYVERDPVEIYYPVPVYTGVIVMNPVVSDGRGPKLKRQDSQPAKPADPAPPVADKTSEH